MFDQRERAPAGNLSDGRFLQRVLIVGLVIALALLAWQWRQALLMLFGSVLIACGLRGLADLIRRFVPIGAGWSIALALLLVVAILAGIGFLFGSQIAAQIENLMDTLPGAVSSLQERVSQTEFGRMALDQVQTAGGSGGVLSGLAQHTAQFGFTFASAALDAFIVVVAAIFLALKPTVYRDGLLKLVPKGHREKGRDALNASGKALQRWLVGTLFSMVAMSLMVTLGLFALGVPAALALGLIAGLAQFVPFIGPILASVPGILLAFTVSPATAGLATLLYFAASTIEANILYPLIQQKAVEQPPVITLFTVIAFGLVFGSLGVVLAVPITVVLTIFIVMFYIRGALKDDARIPGE